MYAAVVRLPQARHAVPSHRNRPLNKLGRSMALTPYTWTVVSTLVAAEVGFVQWFEPGIPMLVTSAGVTMALLILWPAILCRSPAFVERAFPSVAATSDSDAQSAMAELRRLAERAGDHR